MNIQQTPLQFPIRTLAERTGVAATTLRAWERRYGLLKPRRTPKGHRLYDEQDVQLVTEVLVLLKQGHAISEVARKLNESETRAQNEGVEQEAADIVSSLVQRDDQWRTYIDGMMTAVEDFSQQRLDGVYNEASSLYPIDLVSRHLIEPTLKGLGDRWDSRDTGIAEEHFFAAWLRNKLGARLHHSSTQAKGNKIIVACLPGHRHEIGSLLFSLAALSRGYRVIYLGADMPLKPMLAVVKKCGVKGVVVAGNEASAVENQVSDIADFASKLPCPLFVGDEISVTRGEALVEAGVMPVGEQFSLALHLLVSKVPVHDNAMHD